MLMNDAQCLKDTAAEILTDINMLNALKTGSHKRDIKHLLKERFGILREGFIVSIRTI